MAGCSLRKDGRFKLRSLSFLRAAPVPGEKCVEPFGWMAWQTRAEIAQIGFRIEVVEFGGFNQAVDAGGALAALVRTGKQPVLAAKSDRADGALCDIVVDFETAVVAIAAQRRPAVQRIADRPGEFALAGDPRQGRLQPVFHLLEERTGADLPDFPADRSCLSANVTF